MDCSNCGWCSKFEYHSWRFECLNCYCANYSHYSYIETLADNWTDNIVSTSIAQLNDYKGALELAKRNDLIWLPIGLREHQIKDFTERYEQLFGLVDNSSNRQRRAINIAFQIPAGDFNVNTADVDINKIDIDPVSEREYNFKNSRDSDNLGFGELEEVDCDEECFSCHLPYVESDRFCVRITHSGINSWHMSCFKCIRCQETLADFHYYWSNDRVNVFCMRHFDDLERSRCAGCDQLIFHNEYLTAMEKPYHVGHFACRSCNEGIIGGKFSFKDNCVLCLKCYEMKYSNICDRCCTMISYDSKSLEFDNRHWHQACFHCDLCKQSLFSEKFSTNEKDLYCQTCYDENIAPRCQGCKKPIKPGFKRFQCGETFWHEDCFICENCQKKVGGRYFPTSDDKRLCPTCYEDIYLKTCFKCSLKIKKDGLTFKNESWHKECFVCTNCDKLLVGVQITSKDDKPYCQECFGDLFSKRCRTCRLPITGFDGSTYISLKDDDWHSDCFKCSKCNIRLASKQFNMVNEKILCTQCGSMESDF